MGDELDPETPALVSVAQAQESRPSGCVLWTTVTAERDDFIDVRPIPSFYFTFLFIYSPEAAA